MIIKRIVLVFCFGLFVFPGILAAQDRGPEEYDEDRPRVSQKGFHAGLFIGSYFANKHSAALYDGYGYDFEGNRNSFEKSWMYEKIIEQYGGMNNSSVPDYIAEELGVQHGEWFFDDSDMPLEMRYKTAISVGFNGRYSVDEQNAILFNVNAAILKAVGNFNIRVRPLPGSTQINNSIKTFNISGSEQRLLFQLGYQHLFGKGQGIHFFMEGGLHGTIAKFDKNEIQIETLVINLVQDYYDPTTGYTFFTGSKPTGFGLGAFAGLGLHFETNSKWNLQILYNPLLERVNIGYNPKLTLNHTVGLRAYYMLLN